jgi:hypothetical protein
VVSSVKFGPAIPNALNVNVTGSWSAQGPSTRNFPVEHFRKRTQEKRNEAEKRDSISSSSSGSSGNETLIKSGRWPHVLGVGKKNQQQKNEEEKGRRVTVLLILTIYS